MTYKVHKCEEYGIPQTRKRVIFCGIRKDANLPAIEFPEGEYGGRSGKQPVQTVREAIGHLPPIRAGESWTGDKVKPYGYDAADGYVICPHCLQYNLEQRKKCIHCGTSLENPIRGGVFVVPGMGVMANMTKPINRV